MSVKIKIRMATIALITFSTVGAFAQNCKMVRESRDTKLILFDSGLLYSDSYGTKLAGNRFAEGLASCDGRADVRIEKERPSGEGNMVLRIYGSHHKNCIVDSQRRKKSKRFQCQFQGEENTRPTLAEVMFAKSGRSPALTFDQWNYYFTSISGRPGPDPIQFGYSGPRRKQTMDINAWCGHVRSVHIDCATRVN